MKASIASTTIISLVFIAVVGFISKGYSTNATRTHTLTHMINKDSPITIHRMLNIDSQSVGATTIETSSSSTIWLRGSSIMNKKTEKLSSTSQPKSIKQSQRQLGKAWEKLSQDLPILLIILLLFGSIFGFILFCMIFIVLPFQLLVWAWFWYCRRSDTRWKATKMASITKAATVTTTTAGITASNRPTTCVNNTNITQSKDETAADDISITSMDATIGDSINENKDIDALHSTL